MQPPPKPKHWTGHLAGARRGEGVGGIGCRSRGLDVCQMGGRVVEEGAGGGGGRWPAAFEGGAGSVMTRATIQARG